MLLGKPFVYFSEAVITPTRTVDLISQTVAKVGGTNQVDLAGLWRNAALSVRSQASLHRMSGYKGEKYNKWLSSVLDNVANGISFPTQDTRLQFRTTLLSLIGKPRNYYVDDSAKQFIAQLNAHGIGWGVIANESHLYPTILKSLGLNPPGPIVLADGPTSFKPLPKMWTRAIQKTPAASKNDIWFVGSSDSPCDNMSENARVKCALLKPDLDKPDPVSQHFRIRQLDDLLPLLISKKQPPKLDLSFLDDEIETDDGVVLSSFKPEPLPVPPLEGQESNVAELLRKSRR